MADITKDYEKVCFAAPTKLDLWQLEGYFACRDARAGDKRALRTAQNRLEKIKTLQAKTRAPIQPRRLFLEADIARAQGDVAQAADLYGLAAAAAVKHEYHQIAAFALEGRADLLNAAGRADEAAVFYKEAARAYRRWGHMRKAHALEKPEARASGSGLLPTVTAGGTKHSRTNQSTHNDALNLGTVLKVSQQISTQLHATGVVHAVLSGVAENAGAARAVLVLGAADGGERVYAELEHGTYRELDVALEAYLQLPKSLLRVVRRNGKAVVLADAAADPTFGADPFVREVKCRSLACIPLTRRGDWAGCVVLENRLVAGAFTSNLLEIAQPLLTQAAISLDNAALYADMEARVHERTAALDNRNRQMRVVLDNVAQGLIATDRDGRIGAERSAVVERWFDRGVPDTLAELFEQYSPENKPWLDATWDQLHEGFMPIELTCDQLPKLMRVAERELDVAWQPITDATGAFARMLVVMSDVTELRRQQRGEQEQRESLALLERLTRDREGVVEFIKETSAMVTELRLARASREVDKRLVHTLKGNLGLFGLSSISTLCHDIETALAEGQRDLSSDERATLAAAWEKMVERFQRYLSLEDELLQVYRQDYESALRVLRRDTHPLLHDLELWTLEPLKVRLQRIGEQAKAIAERLGKGPLQIRIEHAGIRLDAAQWARFWSSFVHAVRNAIDHGIETPEERAAQGKGRATLRLSAHLAGDELVLECADDGRGVNWEKIREKARSAGLPAETTEDLTQALFSDGISTRDQVSDMSGRGVGMAALAEACTAMSGKITVLSERGAGTTFRFTFPSMQAHVLRELWVSIPPAAE
jgi:HPt (histidine-containing phosphotransfer) domain-containing protein/two-component sensor histidine kinase